jgi:acyl dehydratase
VQSFFAASRSYSAGTMKFAEFSPGQIITAGPTSLTETEIIEFAKQYDPQWFHIDIASSEAGRHKGLIASGWQTCGIAMRLAVDHALNGSESFASPGLAYLKWTHPVRAGDMLMLRATVLETRRSQKQPTMGILRWRWQLFNQHNIEVLDLEATSLFDLTD